MRSYTIKLCGDVGTAQERAAQKAVCFEATRAHSLAAARSLLVGKVLIGKMLNGQQFEIWDDLGQMVATVWLADDSAE